jgi:hypothetical protein
LRVSKPAGAELHGVEYTPGVEVAVQWLPALGATLPPETMGFT